MTNQENTIICPHCKKEINIESIINAGSKEMIEKELAKQKEKFEEEVNKYKSDINELTKKYKKEKETAIENALKLQKSELKNREEEIRKRIEEENKEYHEMMEKELQNKSEQIKDLNILKAENSKLTREKAELETSLKAQMEQEYSLKINVEKQKMQQQAQEKFELKIKELEKQLEDQKQLTDEMKKKQEQGSMQLQGEVQELAIEEYLRENFIYDDISEIGKGDMGADSIQVVYNDFRQPCGTIYYESKRTKTFNESWIDKFKNDIKEKGADIGVIVTAVYPKTMPRMGLYNGIYICTYEEFKSLSAILRTNIIKLASAKKIGENMHDKSQILYKYLTSNEFALQVETIIKGFSSMKNDLENEKKAMTKLWKKREKEIENVINATIGMYGSIEGIAGSDIKKVQSLEMPLLEASDY